MAAEQGVTIIYDDTSVKAGLSALSRRLKNMRPVYRVISEIMKEAVDSNFVAEGARGGHAKWKPLAFATRLGRLNRKMGRGKSIYLKRKRAGRFGFRAKALRMMAPGGIKILQDTGRLRRSCAAGTSFNRYQASVGSDLVYARIHQLGGKAGKGVTIPARPYLFLVSSDLVEIEATIADMLIAEWDRA